MTLTQSRILFTVLVSACASKPGAQSPHPATAVSERVVVETVTVRDADADRRSARLEMRLLERDAQLADFQSRLEEARQEVVRAMAKLQTLASRAESASGMAEAEVALRTLKTGGGQSAPEVAQASALMEQSSSEFNKENYGGALYLANQAKTLATTGRGRLGADPQGAPKAGETPFAVPVNLKTVSKGNVRLGPGTTFKVAFPAESGTNLTGYSYVDEWIRVTDESGRSGWIFRTLVGRR